ncbi:MAG: carboxypeptidase regulatory-like domain-containing protein [Planctomycetes bacterium]|nr:carboxypeptidase regulatory-like domain-containing protein [Planctomycetota bacterium]
MKRLLFALILVLTLLLGVLLIWRTERDAQPPAIPPSAAQEAQPPVSLEPEAGRTREDQRTQLEPSTPPADAAATEEDPDPKAALTVRVVREEDNAPVVGAELRIWVTTSGKPPSTLFGTTDSGGEWRVDLDVPSEVVWIKAEPTDHSPGITFPERIALGADDVRRIELRVPPSGWISGVVVDEAETPVPGARVECWLRSPMGLTDLLSAPPHRVTETDPTGEFRVDGVVGWFVMRATSPGRGSRSWIWGALAPRQEVDGLVLRVTPTRALVGWVVDPANEPAEGVSIELSGIPPKPPLPFWRSDPPEGVEFNRRSPQFTAVTDAEGRVGFEVAAERGFRAAARHPRYPMATAEILPGATEFRIMLSAGVGLTGSVRSPVGAPVAGAHVELLGRERKETETDVNGHFVMEGLSPSSLEESQFETSLLLLTRSPGLAIHLEEISSSVQARSPFKITLEPGHSLGGRVLAVDGGPVPAAWVHIEGDRRVQWDWAASDSGEGRTWERMFDYDRFATNAAGRFRIQDLYPGSFRLTVRLPESDEIVAQVDALSGREDLEIVLGGGTGQLATLRGRVFDSASLAPVPSFRVKLEPWPENDFLPFDDAQGSFEIGAIPPGDLRVTVEAADSSAMARVLMRDLAPGIHELDFPLHAPRTLRLRVLDTNGEPVERCMIEVHDTADRTLGDFRSPGLLAVSGADESGHAVLEGLPAAPVTVAIRSVGRGGGRKKFSFDLTLPLEEVQEVRLP